MEEGNFPSKDDVEYRNIPPYDGAIPGRAETRAS
jgi:hypothetical protein